MAATMPASTRGGGNCAAVPDPVKKTIPAPPGFAPVPCPNAAVVRGTKDKTVQDKKNLLQLANVVDARAQNGNKGAQAAQGLAIESVEAHMGMKVDSATQAAIVSQSSKVKATGKKVIYVGSVAPESSFAGTGANTPSIPSQVKIKVGQSYGQKSEVSQSTGGEAFNPMAGNERVDFTDTKSEASGKTQTE